MIDVSLKVNDSVRMLQKEDLDIILEWRNHEAVRSYMFNKEMIKREDHFRWYESLMTRTDRFAFCFAPYGEIKGFAQISLTSGGVAEWGFYVNPNTTPGIGKYLAYNVIEFLFNEMNVRKISARVIDFNQRSIALHKKFNFVAEGVLRQEHLDKNHCYDVICFGLLKNEWTGKGQ